MAERSLDTFIFAFTAVILANANRSRIWRSIQGFSIVQNVVMRAR